MTGEQQGVENFSSGSDSLSCVPVYSALGSSAPATTGTGHHGVARILGHAVALPRHPKHRPSPFQSEPNCPPRTCPPRTCRDASTVIQLIRDDAVEF